MMYNTYMKILYTGIGCNNTGEHTLNEFLDIMNTEFAHKSWSVELTREEFHYQLQFKDWILPDDFIFFTLSDWIEYSGAEIGV
jgi:hypothetical protein